MSRWHEIAMMRPSKAKRELNAILRDAERKKIICDALRHEWARSACGAALGVRALDPALFSRMGDGRRNKNHWREARDHAAWMLRQLGFNLEEASKYLHCERTAVSRMSRRYAPI